MNIYMIAGLAGAGCYLASYILLQLRRIDGNGMSYTVLNVVAASLLLVSLFDQFNLASALIQVLWIAFGAYGVGVRLVRRGANAAPAAEREPVRPATPQPAGTYQTLPPRYEPQLRSLEQHVETLRQTRKHHLTTSV